MRKWRCENNSQINRKNIWTKCRWSAGTLPIFILNSDPNKLKFEADAGKQIINISLVFKGPLLIQMRDTKKRKVDDVLKCVTKFAMGEEGHLAIMYRTKIYLLFYQIIPNSGQTLNYIDWINIYWRHFYIKKKQNYVLDY